MAAAKRKRKPKAPEYPDTPSGRALAKVGDLNGEDVDHTDADAVEEARAQGEAYAAEKRKNRWGN
jgi:hypothetical protein